MDNKSNSVLFLAILLFMIWLNRSGKLRILKLLILSGSEKQDPGSSNVTPPTMPTQPPLTGPIGR